MKQLWQQSNDKNKQKINMSNQEARQLLIQTQLFTLNECLNDQNNEQKEGQRIKLKSNIFLNEDGIIQMEQEEDDYISYEDMEMDDEKLEEEIYRQIQEEIEEEMDQHMNQQIIFEKIKAPPKKIDSDDEDWEYVDEEEDQYYDLDKNKNK